MLIEIAKQQLRKAGWYEGRKIDLTKYEEEYAKLGLKLFPAARKFLEEFGDLDIQDKYLSTSTDKNGNRILIINRSVTGIPYCCFKPSQEIIDKVGKNILPVGLIDHGNIYIYISTDGKIYTNWYNIGLWAENADQLWNEYYGEDEGWATWDDLKAGKGRTMRKKRVKKYL